MVYHFNVTGPDRKKLAGLIGEQIGQEPKYMRVPSCSYQIGEYNLSKEGALSWNDLDDADPKHMEKSCNLIQALEAAGYHSEEADYFAEQEVDIEEQSEEEQESSENLRRQIKDALEANKQLENALSESKREIFKLQNGRH